MELQMSWQPSLLSEKRKKGPPVGLKNLGNSCYLNSVLQCLTYTPPLANFCLRFQHSSSCDAAAVDAADRKRECPFCVLEKRIARSLSVDLTLDAPAKIQSCLKIFAEHFRCGRQEDAHEFLRYVIDACHNTCLRLKKLRRKGSEPFPGNTVVKEIFGGALQSQVKCLSCGAESNKVDDIMDISLDILHSSSLKEAMYKFFKPEILDGNNKYKCDNCKKLVAARKQMSIHQAPNILVIQLKRFEGIFGGKIDKAIAFEEVLVLSSFMCKASQDPRPEYSLFATIVHSGYSPESGHYYAYIKDAMGRWYCCNDSFVSLSTLQDVLSEKVYILFFSRNSQRPEFANTTFIPNRVKSRDSNGSEASKSLKTAVLSKAAHVKPDFEQSSRKDMSSITKVGKVPSSPHVRFSVSEKSGSENIAHSDNGQIDAPKSQKVVHNGVMKEKIHMEMKNKDSSDKITKCSAAVGVNGEASLLANENGRVQGVDGAKLELSEHNVTRSMVTTEQRSDVQNGTRSKLTTEQRSDGPKLINGSVKGHSDTSGSKRKSEGSCSLLEQDAQSQAKVEDLKEVLGKEAASVLRSCGWYENVYSFMRSRKRLREDAGGGTPSPNDLKKNMIADSKLIFISQIPESLKEDLINRLRMFSQEK